MLRHDKLVEDIVHPSKQSAEHALERYLNTVIEEGLFSRRANLRFHLETVFEGIPLRQRLVLDIGGGAGLCSFYAALQGATRVVCLEPEAAGSRSGVKAKFFRLQKRLGYPNVELKPTTFQAFDAGAEQFDVILSHNSVNHLDEIACVNLLSDPVAKATYQYLFAKLYSLAAPGATLRICDCSPHNLFPLLGFRNPFAPTIEWHKHHKPQVWASLRASLGFVRPRIRWLSPNSLGAWGKRLFANRAAAYFFRSDFCLTMERPAARTGE